MDRYKDIKSNIRYMIAKLAIRFDHVSDEITKKLEEYLSSDALIFLMCKELSKKSNKIHYHIYAEYDINILQDSFLKKLRRNFKNNSLSQYQFCVQKCKNYNKYMLYILKDMNIIKNKGIPLETLNSFKSQSMEINNDKKLPVYKKLYNRWIKLEESGNKMPDLYSFIANTLILEFDTFCRRAQIIEYAVYIKIRLSDGKNTQNIINDAYGIMDWEDYNERKRDKQYQEYLENNKFLDSDDEKDIEI